MKLNQVNKMIVFSTKFGSNELFICTNIKLYRIIRDLEVGFGNDVGIKIPFQLMLELRKLSLSTSKAAADSVLKSFSLAMSTEIS